MRASASRGSLVSKNHRSAKESRASASSKKSTASDQEGEYRGRRPRAGQRGRKSFERSVNGKKTSGEKLNRSATGAQSAEKRSEKKKRKTASSSVTSTSGVSSGNHLSVDIDVTHTSCSGGESSRGSSPGVTTGQRERQEDARQVDLSKDPSMVVAETIVAPANVAEIRKFLSSAMTDADETQRLPGWMEHTECRTIAYRQLALQLSGAGAGESRNRMVSRAGRWLGIAWRNAPAVASSASVFAQLYYASIQGGDVVLEMQANNALSAALALQPAQQCLRMLCTTADELARLLAARYHSAGQGGDVKAQEALETTFASALLTSRFAAPTERARSLLMQRATHVQSDVRSPMVDALVEALGTCSIEEEGERVTFLADTLVSVLSGAAPTPLQASALLMSAQRILGDAALIGQSSTSNLSLGAQKPLRDALKALWVFLEDHADGWFDHPLAESAAVPPYDVSQRRIHLETSSTPLLDTPSGTSSGSSIPHYIAVPGASGGAREAQQCYGTHSGLSRLSMNETEREFALVDDVWMQVDPVQDRIVTESVSAGQTRSGTDVPEGMEELLTSVSSGTIVVHTDRIVWTGNRTLKQFEREMTTMQASAAVKERMVLESKINHLARSTSSKKSLRRHDSDGGDKPPPVVLPFPQITQWTFGLIPPWHLAHPSRTSFVFSQHSDAYYISLHCQQVYKFFPFFDYEVDELVQILTTLLGLKPFTEPQYIAAVLESSLERQRHSVLLSLLREQPQWIDHTQPLFALLKRLLTDKTMSAYDMELLHHSCRLNEEVTKEAVTYLMRAWSENHNEFHRRRVLAVFERLVDRCILHHAGDLIRRLQKWLSYQHAKVDIYRGATLQRMMHELLERAEAIRAGTLVPLTEAEVDDSFNGLRELKAYHQIWHISHPGPPPYLPPQQSPSSPRQV